MVYYTSKKCSSSAAPPAARLSPACRTGRDGQAEKCAPVRRRGVCIAGFFMTHTLTIRDIRGIRWQVNADFASFFLTPSSPDPRRLLRKRRGVIIKKSPMRVIVAATLSEGGRELPVIIKIYRHAKVGDWIKANLTSSKARKEWKITTAAAERGLRTVVPVAYGERRKGGILRESYLMTVRLFDCLTLEEALFSPDGELRSGALERREILVLLASLLRRMHDRGIYHRDLHPGNFLVGRTGAGTRCIYLLDLHRASLRRSLSLYGRVKSLAQFNMIASLALSNSERLLFFRSYFGDDRPWKNRRRWLLEIIDRYTRRSRWKLWKKRQKRCLRSNKYFMRLNFAGMKGFARRGEWCGEMAEILIGPHGGEETLLKRSRSKELTEKRLVLEGVEKTLVVKHYRRKRGLKALRYIIRRSPALRSWRGAYMLSIRNIRTVEAVAALEERKGPRVLGDSYFISDKIPGAENLVSFVGNRRSDRAAALIGAARFLRNVHDRGIYHADMKATNILVRRGGGGRLEFFLTDLDHVSAGLHVSEKRVLRNLFQLNKSFPSLERLSLRDRYRFLSAYCGPYRRNRLRRLWKAVERATARHGTGHIQ